MLDFTPGNMATLISSLYNVLNLIISARIPIRWEQQEMSYRHIFYYNKFFVALSSKILR